VSWRKPLTSLSAYSQRQRITATYSLSPVAGCLSAPGGVTIPFWSIRDWFFRGGRTNPQLIPWRNNQSTSRSRCRFCSLRLVGEHLSGIGRILGSRQDQLFHVIDTGYLVARDWREPTPAVTSLPGIAIIAMTTSSLISVKPVLFSSHPLFLGRLAFILSRESRLINAVPNLPFPALHLIEPRSMSFYGFRFDLFSQANV